MAGHPITALEVLLGPIVNLDGDAPPMDTPILLSDRGTVFVPHSFYAGVSTELPLSRGTALAWAPFPEVDGTLLVFAGGNPAEPTDESIAVTVSRVGLRALIRDLQSIDRQLDEMPCAS